MIFAPHTHLVVATIAVSAFALMVTLACGETSRPPDRSTPGTAGAEAGHGPPPIGQSRAVPEDRTAGLAWREVTGQGVTFRVPVSWTVAWKADECAADLRYYVLIANPTLDTIIRIDLASGEVRLNRPERGLPALEREVFAHVRQSLRGTWARDPRLELGEALPTSTLCRLVGDFDLPPTPVLPPVEPVEATPGPTDTPWPAPTPAPPTTQ